MSAIRTHTCEGPVRWGSAAAPRKPVRMEVLRDGRTLRFETLVAALPARAAAARGRGRGPKGAGKRQGRMLVGLQFGTRQRVDFGDARGGALLGEETMWRVTTATVNSLVRLVYDKQAREEVSGRRRLRTEATRQSFDFDTKQAIYILGLISLSLGIINLFPFLPLDGGHIFWAAAEKLRGLLIPFSVMERAGIVGFVLVLFLFYIGLTNDIGRISSGEGFGVR